MLPRIPLFLLERFSESTSAPFKRTTLREETTHKGMKLSFQMNGSSFETTRFLLAILYSTTRFTFLNGWPLIEGPACFNPPMNCSLVGIAPIFAFNNTFYLMGQNFNSIVGGFVYRGSKLEALKGSYIFAESTTATILNLTPASNDLYNNSVSILGFLNNVESQIRTFGVDSNEELYLADYVDGFLYGFQVMSLMNTTQSSGGTATGTEMNSGTETGTGSQTNTGTS